MLFLTETTETFRLTTGAALSTDWSVGWVDMTTAGATAGSAQGNVATATTTTIVPAPGTGVQRQLKSLTALNLGAGSQTLTLIKNDGSSRSLVRVMLAQYESFDWVDSIGFRVLDATGATKSQAVVTDGDKGDITVSAGGSTWTIDADVISTYGRTLTAAANAGAARAILALVIGTDVQAYDADLATIAALTATSDNFMQAKAGAWASRTIAQVVADLQGDGLTATLAGFRGIPQNSQSAAYTLVADDAGKHIYHPAADTTARTWTIPANGSVAFPIGTAVTFDNDFGAGALTIAITTDTLVLVGAAGSTGSRTIASGGQATAVKVGATRWRISGTGLT